MPEPSTALFPFPWRSITKSPGEAVVTVIDAQADVADEVVTVSRAVAIPEGDAAASTATQRKVLAPPVLGIETTQAVVPGLSMYHIWTLDSVAAWSIPAWVKVFPAKVGEPPGAAVPEAIIERVKIVAPAAGVKLKLAGTPSEEPATLLPMV